MAHKHMAIFTKMQPFFMMFLYEVRIWCNLLFFNSLVTLSTFLGSVPIDLHRWSVWTGRDERDRKDVKRRFLAMNHTPLGRTKKDELTEGRKEPRVRRREQGYFSVAKHN